MPWTHWERIELILFWELHLLWGHPVTTAWPGKAIQLSLTSYSHLTVTMRQLCDTKSPFLLQKEWTLSPLPIFPLPSIIPQWISHFFHEFTYTLLIFPFFLQIFTKLLQDNLSFSLSFILPLSLENFKKILNLADQCRSSAEDTPVPKKRGL